MTETTAGPTQHSRDLSLGLQIAALIGWVLLSLAAGWIGQLLGGMPGEWYNQLDKPSFNPPSWVFAPVWTTLYLLMGISAWLVWRTADPGRVVALAVFVGQLVLNASWSGVFFGLHWLGGAMIVLVLLVLLLTVTIGLFWRIHRAAALLLLPYLAWCLFAGLLNASLWRMNA